MKLLVFCLILQAIFARPTNKSWFECANKIDSCTTSECDIEQNKCQEKQIKDDDCKEYFKQQAEIYGENIDGTKEWSEEYGELFHSCYQVCIDATSGKYKEEKKKEKACSSVEKQFVFALFAIIALLLI